MLSDITSQWLTEHGFNPTKFDVPGKYDDTPIITAARQGKINIVSELLEVGININHRNMDGTNALWAAAVANNFEIADLLLKQGIDIDNQNDNGATVLMYASSTGKTEWVKYLLNKGADASLKSLDDYTALDLASNIDTLRLLRVK